MKQAVLLGTVLALGTGSTACGDDLPVGPDAEPIETWEDTGAYDQPSDFPREGCEPGTFAGVDLAGVYHARVDFGPFDSTIAFRIDEGIGVIAGRDGATVRHDASDVIVRYADDDRDLVRAIDLCVRDGDGAVRGTYQSCTEGECYAGELVGAKLEPLPGPASDGLTLVGEFGPWPADIRDEGITVNVRVADGVAYLARYQDGLRIVDISDPGAPVELGHLPVESPGREIYNDVKIVDGPGGGRYVLMASDLAGAVVVDVTTPASPTIVTRFGQSEFLGDLVNVHTIFVDGGKAYLANSARGVEIYDLADPTAPVYLGRFEHPESDGEGYVHDLFVAGDRLYANYWDLGMAIVDVSNPAAPAMIGSFRDYGERTSHSSWVTQIGDRTIAVHGDEQWGAHVHIVDVTEGSVDFGNAIAEWETRPEVSVHNVMAMGDRAVLAHYQDGVRVLDLQDPTRPVGIAHFDTYPAEGGAYGYTFFEGAVGIDLDPESGRIYVADSHRGLLILDLDL